MARSTEQVFNDHMAALFAGGFLALSEDYADDAVLMTMDGEAVGKEAVGAFFINANAAFPNFKLTPTGTRVCGDVVLLTWTAECDVATFPYGVDTFVIHDEKIVAQTVWMALAPK